MEVSKSFRYISICVIFFNVCFVITTLSFVIICLAKFQFWRLESIVFKSDLFKLLFCMKIQVFVNLFCTLLNNYALNIASKSLLRFTSFLLIVGIGTTITFICLIRYSYNRSYPNIIKNGYLLNLEIRAFINDRYSNVNVKNSMERDDVCIKEFDEVSYYISMFLYISLAVLIVTYLFSKVFVYIKISKPNKVKPILRNVDHVAMDTGTLRNLKVVEK